MPISYIDTLLIVVSSLVLGACGFPLTKMEPVGETQMQTQQQPSPDQPSPETGEKNKSETRAAS
jgi:hypothetical protein